MIVAPGNEGLLATPTGVEPAGRDAILVFIAAALLAACTTTMAPPPPTPEVRAERERQYEAAAARLLAHMERVSRVGARMTVTAAPLCGDEIKPFVGLLSTSRTSLARQFGSHRAWLDASKALREAWQIDGAPEVLAVLPDSPAAKAGLRAGDHVVDMGAENERADAPLWIEVERSGRHLRARIPYVAECDYGVAATVGDHVNAHVDGPTIIISTGLLRFAESDDELAFVIGHELAHRILGHRRARIRGRERTADQLGVQLAARAGYDPTAAIRFVRRLAAEHPELISEKASPAHPGTAHRVAALEQTIAEMRFYERRSTSEAPARPDETAPAPPPGRSDDSPERAPAGEPAAHSTKIGDDQARSPTGARQSSISPPSMPPPEQSSPRTQRPSASRSQLSGSPFTAAVGSWMARA